MDSLIYKYIHASKQKRIIALQDNRQMPTQQIQKMDDRGLVDEISEALYDMEGIRKGISLRTVQNDIQIMRSDKLGYNAPIEVYDQKYYKYADPNYSITELPLTAEDFNLITKAVKMLETTEDKPEFQQMGRILTRVKKRLTAILNYG